jgi:hypothetical protein
MRLKDSTPDVLLSASIVKMEEKKRPAMHDHESTGPPLKRQATAVNGGSKPHPDADMPWKDDIEVRLSSSAIYLKGNTRLTWDDTSSVTRKMLYYGRWVNINEKQKALKQGSTK